MRPTSFLPMKTPMSLEIISNWSLPHAPKHTLTVKELLESQASLGRRVGMIIDLANHECLYADDIPAGLEYAHVQLVAKVLPPQEAIDDVQRTAEMFWMRRPDEFIAIHCAYGFNRTGFVVCSYLCQACGMSVDEALESFAEARPPGVKHGKFVDELYARYGFRNRLHGQSVNGVGCNMLPHGPHSKDTKATEEGSQGGIPGTVMGSSPPLPVGRRGSAPCNELGPFELEARQEPFDMMAQCLDERSLMRRETSIGLAKALHEDFGVHGSTPGESSPLMDRLKEEGEISAASPPDAKEPRSRCNEDLASAFKRNLSFESDTHSLGLSTRQVMAQLRGGLQTRSNTVAELTEQDVEDWEKTESQLPSTRQKRRGCRPM